MGFWIYMLIMDLLIPTVMVLFGRAFLKKAPKEINYVFGYRTSRSMKNRDTWEFAHQVAVIYRTDKPTKFRLEL